MTDLVEKAIAATAEQEQTVTMADVPVTLTSTGRPAIVSVPVDLTDVELHELVAFALLGLPHRLAQARGDVRSRLILPT